MTKPIKPKKCIVCSVEFMPYNSLQRVCSSKCAIEYGKEKQAVKQSKIDNDLKQGFEEKSIQDYLKTTKTIVHKMVRLRDEGKPCVSCGVQWNSSFQAGHFYKAETYKSLRFDFFNISGQCVQCNIRKDGNFDEYSLKLPYRIGTDEFDKLKKRAELDKHFNKHWTRTELQDIREQAKAIIKTLD